MMSVRSLLQHCPLQPPLTTGKHLVEEILDRAVANGMLHPGAIKKPMSNALSNAVKQPNSALVKVKHGTYALKSQVCSGSNLLAPLSLSKYCIVLIGQTR